MRVATKLSAGFALHIAVLGALLLYHVRTIREAVRAGQELSEISSRIHLTAREQLGRLSEIEENAAKRMVTADAGYLRKFRQLCAAHDAELRSLLAMPLGQRERVAMGALAAEWERFGELAEGLALDGPGTLAAPPESYLRLQEAVESLRARTRHVAEASQAAMTTRLAESALAARKAERLSGLAAAAALLLSVAVSALVVRSISDPLRRLAHGAREVARGRFDHRVDESRGDEFAQMSRDFNSMTRRLGELDRMKRDFVLRVSHDLKTPLVSVQEAAEALLDEVPGPLADRQRRLVLLIEEAGERLSAMLAKLLDLSRLEAGVEPTLRPVAVGPLVQRAAEQAARTEGGPRVAVGTLDQRLILECDAVWVRELVDNLVDNALKFSPPHGTVEVELRSLTSRPPGVPPERWAALRRPRPSSAVLLLAVSDEGPGIPDEQKERVFERFHQTDAGRAAPRRGVGLGLAICQEIVVAHGGAIWATDRATGGSVFNVLLPRVEAARDFHEDVLGAPGPACDAGG